MKFIGTEFFPDQDEGQFTVTVKLPVGTRVEETLKATQTLEKILQKNVPEVQTIITDIGVPSAKRELFRKELRESCREHPGWPYSE